MEMYPGDPASAVALRPHKFGDVFQVFKDKSSRRTDDRADICIPPQREDE